MPAKITGYTVHMYWIYENNKHRYTLLDSLPEAQSRVNNLRLAEFIVHSISKL